MMWGCQPDGDYSSAAPGPYWSVKDYIASEFIQGDSLHNVVKVLYIDDKEERQSMTNYNIKSDLESWSRLDINQTKYYGTYVRDSTPLGPSSYRILYRSLIATHPVQEISIQYAPSGIVSIELTEQSQTAFLKKRRSYTLQPGIGYSYSLCDTMRLGSAYCNAYAIEF